MRLCERNNSADTRVSEEGGRRRCLRHQSREPSLVTHDERPWLGSLSPCSPWRSVVQQLSTCSLWKTPCWSRCVPEGGCDPMGSSVLEQAPARTCGPVDGGTHARAGLLAGLVTLWRTHTGAACS